MQKSLNPVGGNDIDLTSLQQAAEWFSVLRDEFVAEADRIQWKVWLNAHPAHEAAWQEVQAVNSPFTKAASFGDKQAVKVALSKRSSTSRRDALKLLGFGGTALITGILIKQSPWKDWITDFSIQHESFRVAVGETAMKTLPDGTTVWLNTGSRANVNYSFALRRISLLSGEISVKSAKDDRLIARSLVVDTTHGRLTALGTRFTVKTSKDSSFLAVYEGSVSIQTVAGSDPVIIPSGKQAYFSSSTIYSVGIADKAREAWTRGILLADNRRLDDFIAELASYRSDKLSVAPEIAQLRLLGAYPLKDTNRILASISEALPVTISQKNGNEIVLIRR